MPRLDQALVEQNLAPSRAAAQRLIAGGFVRVNGVQVQKASQSIGPDAALSLAADAPQWVSRGAEKLLAALAHFSVSPEGLVCLDIGASTGGFTEVLLRRGAARVYAVDVGQGQLAPHLAADARVRVMDKTNARDLEANDLQPAPQLIVCDASFISLKLVLPAAMRLAVPDARLLALIKPQFEVGKGNVGKGGIVKDPALHRAVCEDIQKWCAGEMGWRVLGIIPSPITGGDGNQEFLLGARRG